MTLPTTAAPTLDRTYGADNVATLADMVISLLIASDHLDATNPRLVGAYQELAYDRLGVTAADFYTATYYSPALAASLHPTELADFAGDFALLNERVDRLFA